MRTIQFTQSGYDELKKEYKNVSIHRSKAVEELAIARGMGDLSENAAYKVARQKLSRIDYRLRYLTSILKKAKVVEQKNDGFIDIGSTAIISDGENERTVTLVDGYESDIMKGKISVYSPIGKELRGKRKGDKIQVQLPNNKQIYTIINLY